MRTFYLENAHQCTIANQMTSIALRPMPDQMWRITERQLLELNIEKKKSNIPQCEILKNFLALHVKSILANLEPLKLSKWQFFDIARLPKLLSIFEKV